MRRETGAEVSTLRTCLSQCLRKFINRSSIASAAYRSDNSPLKPLSKGAIFVQENQREDLIREALVSLFEWQKWYVGGSIRIRLRPVSGQE